MKANKRYRRHMMAVVCVGLALLLLAPTTITQADRNPNPGVLPPKSHAYGMTYAQWSTHWWQWALSIPTASNPLLDHTGANCGVGQTGKVWFLGGLVNTSGAVTRTCAVPAGKALFFPLNATECDTTPPPIPVDQCPGALAGLSFVPVEATLDGVVLDLSNTQCPAVQGTEFVQRQSSYCVGSSTYNVTLPSDNVFGAPAGTYQAVDEGIFLMVAPLAVGNHTLHFASPAPGNGQDITYHLIINP